MIVNHLPREYDNDDEESDDEEEEEEDEYADDDERNDEEYRRLRGVSSDDGHPLPGTSVADLQAQFRAVLTQIVAVSAKMGPLDTEGGVTFFGTAELGDDVDEPVGGEREKAKWTVGVRSGGKRKLDGMKVTPLRSIEAGAMVLELWVEESVAKGKLAVRK